MRISTSTNQVIWLIAVAMHSITFTLTLSLDINCLICTEIKQKRDVHYWSSGVLAWVCSAYRKGHLSNSIEEHLQGCKEEEARVQVGVVNAIWSNVGPQKQCRADDAGECCLHISAYGCIIKKVSIYQLEHGCANMAHAL